MSEEPKPQHSTVEQIAAAAHQIGVVLRRAGVAEGEGCHERIMNLITLAACTRCMADLRRAVREADQLAQQRAIARQPRKPGVTF